MPFTGSGRDEIDTTAARVLRQPSRVIINPTTTAGRPSEAGVLPWGGTYLGRTVTGAVLTPHERVTPLRFHRASGARPYAYHRGGFGELVVRIDFAETNGDTLQLAFPRMCGALDVSIDSRSVQVPGGRVPEIVDVTSDETVALAIIPYDLDQPALYLRACVPHQDPDRGMSWRMYNYGSPTVYFRALLAASDTGEYPDAERIGVVAPWEDINLNGERWFDQLVSGASFILAPESLMWQDAARTTLATADGHDVRAVQDARGLAIYATAESADHPMTREVSVTGGHVCVSNYANTERLIVPSVGPAFPRSAFMVYEQSVNFSGERNKLGWRLAADSETSWRVIINRGRETESSAQAGGTVEAALSGALPTGEAKLVSAVWPAPRSRWVRTSGARVDANGGLSSATTVEQLVIGQTTNLSNGRGRYICVVAYDRDLTNDEVAQNESVITAHFGVGTV